MPLHQGRRGWPAIWTTVAADQSASPDTDWCTTRTDRVKTRCLVVHPLSYCDIWYGGDPGAARDAVPPSAAPDERVLVRVPVLGGAPDGLVDLRPSLEAAPF